MICHQAKIRSQHAKEHPRPRLASLDGCTVEPISYHQAATIILEFEWLKTMGRTIAAYGLFSPTRELLGATCFGHPPNEKSRGLCGSEFRRRVICLERGACVAHAPLNAASFLDSRAVKLAALAHGWRIVVAYADESAGEAGTIYQSLGWRYLGQGTNHGLTRLEWKKPGGTRWTSSRNLHHQGFVGKGSWARARRAGWVSRSVPSRHKYVCFIGADAEKLERLALERLGWSEWPKAPRRPRAHRNRTKLRQKKRRGLVCRVCSVTLSASRSDAQYCSTRHRVKAFRSRIPSAGFDLTTGP